MTRLKKTIRNLLIIAVLLLLFMKLNGLYFTPEQALHASERDLHYGPSEIVHSFDYDNSRFFLTKYEGFISCSPIERALGVFWRYGAGYGTENQNDRQLYFNYRSGETVWYLYGIRNDPVISSVKIELQNQNGTEKTLGTDVFYEDMFYVIWEGESEDSMGSGLASMYITAYDDTGAVVYETAY